MSDFSLSNKVLSNWHDFTEMIKNSIGNDELEKIKINENISEKFDICL